MLSKFISKFFKLAEWHSWIKNSFYLLHRFIDRNSRFAVTQMIEIPLADKLIGSRDQHQHNKQPNHRERFGSARRERPPHPDHNEHSKCNIEHQTKQYEQCNHLHHLSSIPCIAISGEWRSKEHTSELQSPKEL